jgi:hypothetical protein
MTSCVQSATDHADPLDGTPLVDRLSRSLNRKSMKGTKGMKDPEGIEASDLANGTPLVSRLS